MPFFCTATEGTPYISGMFAHRGNRLHKWRVCTPTGNPLHKWRVFFLTDGTPYTNGAVLIPNKPPRFCGRKAKCLLTMTQGSFCCTECVFAPHRTLTPPVLFLPQPPKERRRRREPTRGRAARRADDPLRPSTRTRGQWKATTRA